MTRFSLACAGGRRLQVKPPAEHAMSDKQKIPPQQQPPKDQQRMQRQATDRPDGKRGQEDPELHRQSGHRVGDQGAHKRK